MRSLFFRLYLFLALTFIGLGWSLDRWYDSDVQRANVTTDLDLHRGTLFMLNRELSRQPAEQHKDYLDALAGSFGYPLSLVTLPIAKDRFGETALTPEQREYLANGAVVAVFNDYDGTSFFLQKLNNQPAAIVIGPIINNAPAYTETWLTSVFLLGLAASVFIWVWPISRSMLRLSKAADAFGSGDLDARADSGISRPLQGLACHFNAMAERIQKLISSHKALSHAVSHELRTPIARIRFALEMVRDARSDDVRARHLDTMDRNIEELDGLVEELLVYARFDREEPELVIQQTQLEDLLRDVATPFQQQYSNFAISVCNTDVADDTIECDASSLTRVFDNLIRNAVRYAETRIDVILSQTNSNRVRIAVNDDGEGIPDSDRATLFAPFVRLDQSRDRNSGGIGLGLAIVKRYVELHGGSVSIHTSPYGGASFVVELPRTQLAR